MKKINNSCQKKFIIIIINKKNYQLTKVSVTETKPKKNCVKKKRKKRIKKIMQKNFFISKVVLTI